jgi:hypothetical protein
MSKVKRPIRLSTRLSLQSRCTSGLCFASCISSPLRIEETPLGIVTIPRTPESRKCRRCGLESALVEFSNSSMRAGDVRASVRHLKRTKDCKSPTCTHQRRIQRDAYSIHGRAHAVLVAESDGPADQSAWPGTRLHG